MGEIVPNQDFFIVQSIQNSDRVSRGNSDQKLCETSNKSSFSRSLLSTKTIVMKSLPESPNKSSFTWAIFLLSFAWFRSWQRNKLSSTEKEKKELEDDEQNVIENDTIGPRGASALKKTASYWEGFMECLRNPCDPNTNPTGHIALCLAENKLVQEALAVRLMQQGTAITAFSDSVAYCYSGFLGLPSARFAAASFLEKHFWKKKFAYPTGLNSNECETLERKEDFSISPEHVAFGSGVGSLLNHLFFILAQKGDVVLIPAPYYAAFDYDAKAIAGCITFPVYQDNPMLGPSLKDLDNAMNLVKAVRSFDVIDYILIQRSY